MKVKIIIDPKDLLVQADIVKILKMMLQDPKYHNRFEFKVTTRESA